MNKLDAAFTKLIESSHTTTYSKARPRSGVYLGSELWGSGGEAEDKLRKAFSWLSRIGAGPKSGSRPIGWYQQHQVAAIDVIIDRAKKSGVSDPEFFRHRAGIIEVWNEPAVKWRSLDISSNDVFRAAEKKV